MLYAELAQVLVPGGVFLNCRSRRERRLWNTANVEVQERADA
jgi:hypothetical protein